MNRFIYLILLLLVLFACSSNRIAKTADQEEKPHYQTLIDQHYSDSIHHTEQIKANRNIYKKTVFENISTESIDKLRQEQEDLRIQYPAALSGDAQ